MRLSFALTSMEYHDVLPNISFSRMRELCIKFASTFCDDITNYSNNSQPGIGSILHKLHRNWWFHQSQIILIIAWCLYMLRCQVILLRLLPPPPPSMHLDAKGAACVFPPFSRERMYIYIGYLSLSNHFYAGCCCKMTLFAKCLPVTLNFRTSYEI